MNKSSLLNQLWEQIYQVNFQLAFLDSKQISKQMKLIEDKRKILDEMRQIQPVYLQAANLKCSLINALSMKYHKIQKESADAAFYQLNKLMECLIKNGFLTEQELKEAL